MFTFSPFNAGENVFNAASVNVGVTVIKASQAVYDSAGAETRDEQARLAMHPYTMNILQKSVEKRLPNERHRDSLEKQVCNLKRKMEDLHSTCLKSGGFRPAETGRTWRDLKDSFLISALLEVEEVKAASVKITAFMNTHGLMEDELKDAVYGIGANEYDLMVAALRQLTDIVREQAGKGTKIS
jgi:hypothetical protein